MGKHSLLMTMIFKVIHPLEILFTKKVAPLTELTDKYISTKNDTYLQELEWKHKEYITPEYLNLKESDNYKLTG